MTNDITGKKFGHLTAIKFDHRERHKNGKSEQYWLFKCDCGNEKVISKQNVVRKYTKSCGCKRFSFSHCLSYTRLYNIWEGMKQRCLNNKNHAFCRYGGRGIKICEEWLKDIKKFYEWAKKSGYREDLTIDRIDVNGDYCPGNCRWATQKEQQRNRRNNKTISFKGEKLCQSEFIEKYGKEELKKLKGKK